MSTFVITLLWILSLALVWAYWSYRYNNLSIDHQWVRGQWSQASDRAQKWFDENNTNLASLNQLQADRDTLAEECRNNYSQLERSQASENALRERLVRAEQLCTANLNKSFRARLPWPTVFARAFSEDDQS